MTTSGSSDEVHHHGWLKWLGVNEPPEPDAWTPIVKDQILDDVATGYSDSASRIVDVLKRGGIEAHQRSYVLPDPLRPQSYGGGFVIGVPGPDAIDRIRVAVLVHNRDLERANGLPELREELGRDRATYPVSDEELTRESLEAGKDIRRQSGADE